MYYDEQNIQLGLREVSQLKLEKNQACLIFVAENSKQIVSDIRAAFPSDCSQYIGGIFPSVIANGRAQTEGFVATVVPVVEDPILVDLGDLNPYDENIQKLNQQLNEAPHNPLMMVFSANSIEQLADQNRLATFLRDAFSNKVSYIGGCSGSAGLGRTPSIFNHTGVYDHVAAITVIDRPSYASAQIGWKPAGRPNFVTSLNEDGTVIRSVNNRKASSWFLQEYAKLRKQEMSESDISFASNMQIGFFSFTGGYIVRAVLGTTPDGGLIIGGTILPNTAIRLMDTDPHNARVKIEQMVNGLKQKTGNVESTFVIECVTRPIILGKQFETELQSIENIIKDNQLDGAVGFVALGEFGVVEGANHVDLLNVSLVLSVSENTGN